MNNTYGVPASAYMHVMLRTLLSLHYAQFVTLRGVPYDWRLPPWQLNYDLLKKDIEDRYEELHQRKVELISHSLGGIVLCYFLNKVVDQEWKDKYIGSFTLVAPATGGSFKAIKSLLSGYNDAADFDIWNVMDISLFPAILLRDLLQTMGSIYALLPDPAIYGTERVIVRVARPSKTGDRTFVPSSAGVNIEELSPQEGLTADEMRRRLEAIDGTPMGDVKSEKEHGTTVPDLIGESRKEKLSGSAADGEPDLYVYKLSETFGFGSENDRAGLTDSATEEDREKEAEERRQAVLREIEELNRVPHEERAARQRARHKQHVEREQKRLQEALRLAESQGLEEDVYTLSNWTSLLPANLQQRVLTAREKMAGVVADPGVPVRCIWSKFSYPTTDVAYYYPWGNLDRHPIPIFDYGDDTVPLPSLSLCASWPSTVKTTVLDNLDHMYIFADRGFNKIIYNMFSPVPAAGAQPTVLYPSEAKSF
ncbi:phosphatidylcholine-sterol o-acyltransferase [Cystoisospora suis]|uniref:Phosphatidylcholine-sterol o-acyltransferase n=1 Tax=Cystoisospora suis TaxID=483139 RepID=A0A2C6KRB9_9APIC|nr:phosphatidylcholine-sterol o-acyltransferase [Cystoisospora suis]